MPKKVEDVIEFLENFLNDALVHACVENGQGVIVVSSPDGEERRLGYLETGEIQK